MRRYRVVFRCPTCGRCGDARLLDVEADEIGGWLVWQTSRGRPKGIENHRTALPAEMQESVWIPFLARLELRLSRAVERVHRLRLLLELSLSSKTVPSASVKGAPFSGLLREGTSSSTFRSVPTMLRNASLVRLRGVPLRILG